jgi:hypothetical protein
LRDPRVPESPSAAPHPEGLRPLVRGGGRVTGDVFAPHPHPSIPTLATLREIVLEQNRKRRPKWRFRLAPDLIVQLQPANKQARRIPRHRWDEVQTINKSDAPDRFFRIEALMIEDTLVFEGVAIVGAEDVTSFDKKPTGNPAPWVWLKFGIYADADDAWTFEPRGCWYKRGTAPADAIERVRSALTPERFSVFKPEMMLSPRCLACGKQLSDPASLARWIGPECSGTTSLSVPRVFLAALEGRV